MSCHWCGRDAKYRFTLKHRAPVRLCEFDYKDKFENTLKGWGKEEIDGDESHS